MNSEHLRIDILQECGSHNPLNRALRSERLRIDGARAVGRIARKLAQVEITIRHGVADAAKLQAERDLRRARVLVVARKALDVDSTCAGDLGVEVFGNRLRDSDQRRARVDGGFRGIACRALSAELSFQI